MDGTISKKCERAFAALLANALSVQADFDPESNIYTGKGAGEKVSPCVICEAQPTPEEDPPRSGNFWVPLKIMTRKIAATDTDNTSPESDSDSLSQAVSNAIVTDSIAEDVSEFEDDFTAQGVLVDSQESTQVDDCWEDVITLKVYCCASDL